MHTKLIVTTMGGGSAAAAPMHPPPKPATVKSGPPLIVLATPTVYVSPAHCTCVPNRVGSPPESIVTYLLEQYHGDVQGYNVTQAVHVQACWLGDPVGETM